MTGCLASFLEAISMASHAATSVFHKNGTFFLNGEFSLTSAHNDREKARNASLALEMVDGKTTVIRDPNNPSAEPKTFTFDFSYWSHDGYKIREDGYYEQDNSRYADQMQVFNDLGVGVLDNAWKGYNCSLFAYGQTGSGKSYSMVGYGANKGIVPVACEELFKQIDQRKTTDIEFQVTVSMLEIYCEKVRDLLNPSSSQKGGLKVREHPKKGFYVDGLIAAPVSSYKAIESKIKEGTENRTVAATQMNATSSRAHTIVQINFTQKTKNTSGENMTKTSCINLVDLAGSERQAEAGTEGERLKEGIVINQSLSTLGRCIKALAEHQKGRNKAAAQIPFRDSILTSLLKNALGGNSKTVMIAALSPADINYEETLSALRFADRAKSIKTTAVVNESATDRLIRELREENNRLTSMLNLGGAATNDNEQVETLRQQLEENKREMSVLQQTWQQRLAEETAVGSKDKSSVDAQRKTTPHLWNLNEDPALTNVLVYFLKSGESKVGNSKSQPPADIILNGLSIQPQHATITNASSQKITITPNASARILVNGKELRTQQELFHNDRIMFGTNHLFVLAHPVNLDEKIRNDQSEDVVTYNMAQAEIAESSGLMGLARKGSNGARTKEDLILEEELVRLLPQIYQANAIAEELKKSTTFEIVLVAPQTRGLKAGTTEIIIKVWNRSTDNEYFWDKNKFANRFYGIQEMYQNFAEGHSNFDADKSRDPFFEPPDTEVNIGTAYVFLQSLAFMVELDEQMPITDFKGQERARLRVQLLPCSPQGKEITGEFVDTPEELIGKNLGFKVKILSAVGIPRKFISSRCKYRFYINDEEATAEINGNNPEYNHEKIFKFSPVTKQLIDYLREQLLVIEVMGRQGAKDKLRRDSRISRKNSVALAETSNDVMQYKSKAEDLEVKLLKIQKLVEQAKTNERKSVPIKTVLRVLSGQELAAIAPPSNDITTKPAVDKISHRKKLSVPNAAKNSDSSSGQRFGDTLNDLNNRSPVSRSSNTASSTGQQTSSTEKTRNMESSSINDAKKSDKSLKVKGGKNTKPTSEAKSTADLTTRRKKTIPGARGN